VTPLSLTSFTSVVVSDQTSECAIRQGPPTTGSSWV